MPLTVTTHQFVQVGSSNRINREATGLINQLTMANLSTGAGTILNGNLTRIDMQGITTNQMKNFQVQLNVARAGPYRRTTTLAHINISIATITAVSGTANANQMGFMNQVKNYFLNSLSDGRTREISGTYP